MVLCIGDLATFTDGRRTMDDGPFNGASRITFHAIICMDAKGRLIVLRQEVGGAVVDGERALEVTVHEASTLHRLDPGGYVRPVAVHERAVYIEQDYYQVVVYH
jgi:hypothetical protein